MVWLPFPVFPRSLYVLYGIVLPTLLCLVLWLGMTSFPWDDGLFDPARTRGPSQSVWVKNPQRELWLILTVTYRILELEFLVDQLHDICRPSIFAQLVWKVMSFLVQNSTFGNDQSWPHTCFRRREGSNLARRKSYPWGQPASKNRKPTWFSFGMLFALRWSWNLKSFDFTCFYLSDVDPIPRYAKLQKSMCRRYVGKLVTWNLPEHKSEEMWEYMSENTQIMSDHKRQTNMSQDVSHPICQSKHMRLYIHVRIYGRWNFRPFRKSRDFRRMIDDSLSLVVSEQIFFFFFWTFFGFVSKKMVNPPFVDYFPIKTSSYRRIPAGRAEKPVRVSRMFSRHLIIWLPSLQAEYQEKRGIHMYMGVSINGDTPKWMVYNAQKY